ncbi:MULTISPECIES: hypothetical protein [unclassified Paenibacillus]|uniref:hypothetical protein n=1 Tax=unclassified Paenibacillus TaxID=185978 RepID=UPI002406A4DF|nr:MULTISPECIES: hypothetical protein [unclassified Paenibacillus]MDF9843745.1 putative DNA-binding protein YlxM (UPF0122 family) [Paenibacillus sp. PastF-2]MDF9850416.1 putative DNA-binding protein YlxM (UPF0122 family) [Paenibacillus sp. PastM-2]MDF9856881.1 putative DNA-binding protein YlxM (UPF0122 family) [Paenibacillus sp. PastF-1]MDH6482262.1 putative DNA-binding protein YlxM (UPF0122 family) [Paenibacillus sp. PastH-2]MDH6509574.1 putative DNA-binding protein YlxM (UPF0122 family) [Pae
MRERLPRPTKHDADMWVDEAIWGHRLYDEQTPWLCFIEFLNVLQSEHDAGRGFIELEANKLAYSPKARLYLRNILFNNPQLSLIANRYKHDPKEAWVQWYEVMNKSQAGLINADFSYLEKRFSKFEDFAEVVHFLRETTIEGENNKRWSSQFIFPYGPDCLYEDLKVKDNGSFTNDRRFFGRTGELLYLMLTRSGKGEQILSLLNKSVLNHENKFNRLVAALEPMGTLTSSTVRSGAYLPYLELPDYLTLADDWLGLLQSNIPNYDAIPHLVNITGLHFVIYSLNRAKAELGDMQKLTFVLEIVASKKTVIRDLSSDSFTEHNNLSRRAIESYIRKVVNTDSWSQITDITEAINLLKKEYAWPRDNKENEVESANSPEDLINKFVTAANNRHKQHVDKFHSVWGKEIGLSSRRGARRLRYAPQDILLKSLVLCVVPQRMEFQDFLEKLYEKYGFIIGDKQAQQLTDSGRADMEAFSENARRLEQRLSSMGLLRRLSDACAYVENPFGIREDEN